MADRNLEHEQEWLDEIKSQYGVTLGPGQMYVSRGRYVMAGSECVAEVGETDSPADARNWAPSLLHRPRGQGYEEARRRCGCEALCCERIHLAGRCPGTPKNRTMSYVGPICDECATRIIDAGGRAYLNPVF
jgi:hypothetical protein